jgi:acetyl coenzyme A synthetase (ADP forming)-like protein
VSGSRATAPEPDGRAVGVVLRDGSAVHVRPVRADDAPALQRFFADLSEPSRFLRFFSQPEGRVLGDIVRREVGTADGRFGLVATWGPDRRIIAHAEYIVVGPDRAEVAVAVADAFQGRGLGTLLIGQLAEWAFARGIRVFEAYVLPENYRMLEVFRQLGFPVEIRAAPGELHVSFPTAPTPEAVEHFEQREQVAAVNALRTVFAPRAVAVIGASRARGTIGGELFHNLRAYGFVGPVYPVNRAAATVQSTPAYPTVEAIPGPVDLAVIAVPAPEVVPVAEQCARRGVRALVVISAGFAEVGEEGRRRQAALLDVCRSRGMRLIGPNCMGIVNTDPQVRLNATFAPTPPPDGRVGFLTQSGALGLAILDYATALGLGISTFASVGNKADISGNDLLRYWGADPRTDIVLLYMESFGNPRVSSRLARRLGRTKPIVVVKSGRTPAGTRAAASHTGALLAASDVTVDALFRQAGVIRTDTLEELFDVAALLANQPLPSGRRVAIVTNAGGPGILCADACAAEGLEVPVLGETTQRRLRQILPPEASPANPVDLLASAPAGHYREAVQAVTADPGIDAVVVIFIPPLVTRADDVARAILDAAEASGGQKPILTVFMSARGLPAELRRGPQRLPSYAFPEDAAIALARVARYAEWRARAQEPPAVFDDIRRDAVVAVVAAALRRGGGWLDPDEVARVLSGYGLPLLPQVVVTAPGEAAAAAARLGGSVALKAVVPGLVHKSDVGGVRLGLAPDQVRQAAEEMAERLRAQGRSAPRFLVQPMAGPGVEVLAGVVHDPHFGPVVAVGAGGVFAEVLQDIAVGLAPLTRADAVDMIRRLRSYPLFTGVRGRPPSDVAALEELLLRLSVLADHVPQIAELDCNPVMIHPRGLTVVDARIRIAPAEPTRLLGGRP